MSDVAFSVIIPLFNKAKSIRSTLESALAQNYPRFEIIVIDDGSTDCSAQVVEGFSDDRVSLVRTGNFGVALARNLGASLAGNPFLAFLDADDLWMASYLETLSALIGECPDAGLYGTFYFRDQGVQLTLPRLGHGLCPHNRGYIPNYFRAATDGEQPFFTSSACVPKSVFQSLGGFKAGVRHGEDLDLWARVALKYRVAYAHEPLVIYRTNAENRAMHAMTELKPWTFRTDAEIAIRSGQVDRRLVPSIKDHIGRVELYTVSSNLLNADRAAVLAFLTKIPGSRFVFRAVFFRLILMLPLPLKRAIMAARLRNTTRGKE